VRKGGTEGHMKNWMKEESSVLFPTVLLYSFALVTAPLFLTLSIIFILLNLLGCVCFMTYSRDGWCYLSVSNSPYKLSVDTGSQTFHLFLAFYHLHLYKCMVSVHCQRGIVKGEY